MSRRFARGAGARCTVAALLLAACLSAQGEALRAEVGRPLQQAAEYLKQNRGKEALAKVREAEAVANRTPQENLLIDRMRGAAAARAGEPQVAARSFESVFASGRLSQQEQAQIAEQIAFAYSQLRDWSKTREWAQRAQQAGGNSPQLAQLLSFVNAQSGDFNAIAREAGAAIAAAEAAGNRPTEADLLRLADAQQRTGNTAGQVATIEKLVTFYPKREYWALYLNRLVARPGFSDRYALDVMRLRLLTGNLTKAEEIVEMAQLALQAGQAAEAKKVIDDAFAAGILGKGGDADRHRRLQNLASSRTSTAEADLAKSESEAGSDGNTLVRVGLAYTGLGQHDKGIALIQRGITRGGLRNPADAQLYLGIALYRAGQKQRAVQTFKGVTGTDGAADLARAWMRMP